MTIIALTWKYIKNQYLVQKTWICFFQLSSVSVLSMRLSHRCYIYFCHSWCRNPICSAMFDGQWPFIFLLMTFHMFAMRFRSEDWAGHDRIWIWWSFIHTLTPPKTKRPLPVKPKLKISVPHLNLLFSLRSIVLIPITFVLLLALLMPSSYS